MRVFASRAQSEPGAERRKNLARVESVHEGSRVVAEALVAGIVRTGMVWRRSILSGPALYRGSTRLGMGVIVGAESSITERRTTKSADFLGLLIWGSRQQIGVRCGREGKERGRLHRAGEEEALQDVAALRHQVVCLRARFHAFRNRS